MNKRTRDIVALALLVAGCGGPAAPAQSPPATAGPPATVAPTPPGTPSVTAAPEQTALAELPGSGATALAAGRHTWHLHRAAVDFPVLSFSVERDGWGNEGRFTFLRRPGSEDVQVAMQFWDVGKVYGHPCKWNGTLVDPGPGVDDLANALVEIPLRNASDPVEVDIDGYSGKYLEWSVPLDIGTGTTDQEVFKACDKDGADHYFESWIGDPSGWGGDRYHQAAGQLDRLWILDVDGVRFVIDAFSMPTATQDEIEALVAVVESIRFMR